MTIEKLINWFPLLVTLRNYQKSWLSNDAIAGLSVVAVQIPTAMAYATLAGFPPQVGLYASMFPVIVYGMFSSSRQLVVGPDAATTAMIAACLMPLAHGDLVLYLQLMAALTITTGVLMVIGGFFHVGFFINFFSFPVLIGYLNGIAIIIITGQLGKILNIPVHSTSFGPSLLELAEHLHETHFLSLALGLVSLLLLIGMTKLSRRAPAALIALAIAAVIAFGFGMENKGVLLVGVMPSSLPALSLPKVGFEDTQSIFMHAIALVVMSFTSGMLTGRSFAARNNYSLNADMEMRAIGFANITSGLFGGFAITGADSRTAINNATGGKTQLVSVIAGLGVLGVVLFLSTPLGYLPITALGAVLVFSAWGLLDIAALNELYTLCRFEFWLSVATTVGVLAIGILPGIVMAVSLALVHVLKKIYQPQDAILGLVPDLDGYNDITLSPDSKTIPGILIYRFEGPLLFFNADVFKARIHELVDSAEPPLRWLVLSMEAVTQLDVTGSRAGHEIHQELNRKGVLLLLARPMQFARKFAANMEDQDRIGNENIFPSIRSAVDAALARDQLARMDVKAD